MERIVDYFKVVLRYYPEANRLDRSRRRFETENSRVFHLCYQNCCTRGDQIYED